MFSSVCRVFGTFQWGLYAPQDWALSLSPSLSIMIYLVYVYYTIIGDGIGSLIVIFVVEPALLFVSSRLQKKYPGSRWDGVVCGGRQLIHSKKKPKQLGARVG